MFPNAEEVLRRCHRQLDQGGIVMVACEQIEAEHSILDPSYCKELVKHMLRGRADCSGRYRMFGADYQRALNRAGFDYSCQQLNYSLIPGLNGCPAVNHFGIKN